MDRKIEGISELTSRYVQTRDNFATRYKHRNTGLFVTGQVGGQLQFNDLITEHALQLAGLLPPMTLAQWEGFSELASSYLAHLRLMESGGKK